MIGDSDHYRPDVLARLANDDDPIFIPSGKPREPAIGSSSKPFEGDVYRLIEYIDKIYSRWSDKIWDGLHVAENDKSNGEGEAEIHDTNGRVRLVAANETTRDDCVALLMSPFIFKEMYVDLRIHRQHNLTRHKIIDEKLEALWEAQNLKSEIKDLEKDLLKFQATGPTAAATWRCQHKISELRVRLSAAERREAALEKLKEYESDRMTQLCYRLTSSIEKALEQANLIDHLETPPVSYTDSDTSLNARLRQRLHERLEMRQFPKSTEADIESTAEFPPLLSRVRPTLERPYRVLDNISVMMRWVLTARATNCEIKETFSCSTHVTIPKARISIKSLLQRMANHK